MIKTIVSLNDCTPGVMVAETIFNEYGAIVISENIVLDSSIITRLRNLGIERIKVFKETLNIDVTDTSQVFEKNYEENIDVVKEMLHEISIGKNIDIKKVNKVSDSIIKNVNENRDIVNCINQIRSYDEYTYAHSINVALLCMLIGKWLKYDVEEIKLLIQTGFLHDIGKSMISNDIINKPSSLSEYEYKEIKKHPLFGYKIAENTRDINDAVRRGILMHHEREDGSGYPLGVKGDKINNFAKIVAVADIYDAMTSDRIYRVRESPFEVFELMENGTFGVLDSRVVNAFLSNIATYYIGERVMLSTGDIGEIVYINPRYISKPLVKVNNLYVDLYNEPKVKILELL